MRLAVLGRSEILLATAKKIVDSRRHDISLVGTCRSEAYYRVHEADFEALAAQCGASFFCDARINSPEIRARLVEARADLAVSCNWLSRIGVDAMAAFRYGILNVHAGDLPRFRGNACPNWAILLGEPFVGLCVHRMVPNEIDAGDVIGRDRMMLGPDVYIGDVYAWIEDRAPAMVLDAVDQIANAAARWEPQSPDPEAAFRCYPRRPDDSRIDWTRSSEDVHRLVRASSRPLAGAFTMLEGSARLTIWRADMVEHPGPFAAVPGQVLYADGGCPVVATGRGVVRLTDIELEGVAASEAKPAVLKSLRQRLT